MPKEALGPLITRQQPDSEAPPVFYYPYQEQKDLIVKEHKEREMNTHYDVTIVYGQGPTKDVRFRSELSPEEQEAYDTVQANPDTTHELAYYVIDDAPHGLDEQTGLDKNPYFNMMGEITNNPHLTDEEKEMRIEARRLEWEGAGRYGMMRGGERNALAAGLAMYLDLSDVFILSGGRTISREREQALQAAFAEAHPGVSIASDEYETYVKDHVASEAELMRDLVLRHFGRMMFYRDTNMEELKNEFDASYSRDQLHLDFALDNPTEELEENYQQRVEWKENRERENEERIARGEAPKPIMLEYPLDSFGKYLDARRESYRDRKYRAFEKKKYQEYITDNVLPRLIIEDEALTTPENVAYSVNKYPELFGPESKVAVITIDPHLERAAEFVHRFGGVTTQIDKLSSEKLLEQRRKIRNKDLYAAMFTRLYAEPQNTNVELQERMQIERDKVTYLQIPERIMYWIGYLGLLEDDGRVQGIIDEIREDGGGDHRWIDALQLSFAQAGLVYDETDTEDPENFYHLSIPEVKETNPELYASFKEGMRGLIVKEQRDLVFVDDNGTLRKPE